MRYLLVAIVISMMAAGCAEDRWLTKEEDAELREQCEPVGGCAVVPKPIWEQIKQQLSGTGI